jgi:hypothetical protein
MIAIAGEIITGLEIVHLSVILYVTFKMTRLGPGTWTVHKIVPCENPEVYNTCREIQHIQDRSNMPPAEI